MRPCITCLPITPSTSSNLGLFVIPFVLDVLGTRLGLEKVLAVNVNGLKLNPNGIEGTRSVFIEDLSSLGISNDFVWEDRKKENLLIVKLFFQQLLSSGKITFERVTVMRCPCGVVEMLEDSDNLSERRRLYQNQNGRIYCRLCSQPVEKYQEKAYLFFFPNISPFLDIQSPVFVKEVWQLVAKFAGKKFLISRTRYSDILLDSDQQQLFLDVDFIWYLLLPLLTAFGYAPKILVGGQKNLMACCFILAMFALLNREKATLLVTPYCYAESRTSLKDAFGPFRLLVSIYGKKALRIFLASGLNWHQKESTLEARLLPLIGKLAYRVHGKHKRYETLEQAIADLNSIKTKHLIAAARRTRDEYEFESLSGVV